MKQKVEFYNIDFETLLDAFETAADNANMLYSYEHKTEKVIIMGAGEKRVKKQNYVKTLFKITCLDGGTIQANLNKYDPTFCVFEYESDRSMCLERYISALERVIISIPR